ncbi:SET and MYND domain-containing protein 4 [Sparganum proliferum]
MLQILANSCVVSMKGFLIIRCIRDLVEGDEICACYGPHYLRNPSTEARRRALQEQYFFVCQCRHCLQGEPPQLSPAQSDRWLDLVERLNNEHSVRRIRNLIDKLRSLSSGIVLFPEGVTFGSVLDLTGRRLLETEPTDDVSLKLGQRLVCESVAWVRDRFGADSTEYAWELTKLASLGGGGDLCETNDLNPPSTREQAYAVFQTIMTLHYGQEEARRILRSFLDESGSVSASSFSLAGLAANVCVRKGQQGLATDNSPSTTSTQVEPTERKLSVLPFCFFVFSFSSQNFGLDQCTLLFFRKHCNLMAPIL